MEGKNGGCVSGEGPEILHGLLHCASSERRLAKSYAETLMGCCTVAAHGP